MSLSESLNLLIDAGNCLIVIVLNLYKLFLVARRQPGKPSGPSKPSGTNQGDVRRHSEQPPEKRRRELNPQANISDRKLLIYMLESSIIAESVVDVLRMRPLDLEKQGSAHAVAEHVDLL